MEIGTDDQGRSITYDHTNQRLAIAGITTTPERLVAYDHTGFVNWVSDEFRDWVYEYDRAAREYAARPESHSGSQPVVRVPDVADRHVSPRKPLRAQVVVALVVAGVMTACVGTVLVGLINPFPPLAEERAFRANLEQSLEAAVGDDYTLEFRPSKFERGPSSLVPVAPGWVRKNVAVARSVSNPEFTVSMRFMYGQQGEGDSLDGGVRRDKIERETEWVRTLDQMPADREASFESWWAARPDHGDIESLQLASGDLVAALSLPAGVDPASVYSINRGTLMIEGAAIATALTGGDSWIVAGWDSRRREWIEVGRP